MFADFLKISPVHIHDEEFASFVRAVRLLEGQSFAIVAPAGRRGARKALDVRDLALLAAVDFHDVDTKLILRPRRRATKRDACRANRRYRQSPVHDLLLESSSVLSPSSPRAPSAGFATR